MSFTELETGETGRLGVRLMSFAQEQFGQPRLCSGLVVGEEVVDLTDSFG
jgi:hypothetical protein